MKNDIKEELVIAVTAVVATQHRMAAAFTEWERRYREEPDRFMSEAAKLLKETPENYGEACAPYFVSILQEQAGGRATPLPLPRATVRSLPAIGAAFEGGTFAGVTLADDAVAALVLLPDSAQDIDWPTAREWAKARAVVVPSRIDHLVLLKNLRDRFRTDTYYWSSDEVAGNPEYAWTQDFDNGSQDGWPKSDKLHAVAVRRVTL